MHALKLAPFIALMAAFGFIACDDSSSSSSNGTSCKVLSQEPLVIETVQEGVKSETTFKLEGNKVIETIKADRDIPEEVCNSYKNDSDYGDIECNKNTVTMTSKDELSKNEFETLKNQAINSCKALND